MAFEKWTWHLTAKRDSIDGNFWREYTTAMDLHKLSGVKSKIMNQLDSTCKPHSIKPYENTPMLRLALPVCHSPGVSQIICLLERGKQYEVNSKALKKTELQQGLSHVYTTV
jgi:hypothetical protein